MSDRVGVLVRKHVGRVYLDLRGDAARLREALETVAGVELPREPCTWRRAERAAAYWLGPDEWLLAGENGVASDLEQQLRHAVDGGGAVVDVSGAQIHVELSGRDADKVLRKSSPYDFHPRNFPAGRCVQTVFAKATALVAADVNGVFDIVFRRSYADYLMAWIADAADEYGLSAP